MRSKANYEGHPIHPALIPFPFAFLTGAFFFDGLGWAFQRSEFWTTGSHLAIAGVSTALVAAVPGLIDYLYSVPPNSSGKKRATQHMVLNLTAVAIFTFVWLRRGVALSLLELGVELVGVMLLVAAGWMGGVLVSRNQIGVDHRYAHAGKWKESQVEHTPGEWVAVGNGNDLKINQMKLLRVGDRRVVLARDERGSVAFDDRCPHRGGSLADGTMICGTVQCPWHGSQFDVRSGALKAGPAERPIACFDVDERDGKVYVRL